MPIDETKPASNLVINTNEITKAELQNRFGSKYEVIRDITPGRHLTILAVETDAIVEGEGYLTLETVLKEQFGVRALQTVFGDHIPEKTNDAETFNVHITAHLRIDLPLASSQIAETI